MRATCCAAVLLAAVGLGCAAAAPPPPRVLAFGDALTSGVHATGLHPYSGSAAAALGPCAVVDRLAFSGATAVSLLSSLSSPAANESLASAVAAAKASGSPYTHVVILAGLMDVQPATQRPVREHTPRLAAVLEKASVKAAAKVVDAIGALHAAALAGGVPHTLAVTVPQPSVEGERKMVAALRSRLNAGITALAAASGGRTFLLDAAVVLKNVDATPADRAARWEEDGYHLKPAGSDELGRIVADALLKSGTVGACPPGSDAAAAAADEPSEAISGAAGGAGSKEEGAIPAAEVAAAVRAAVEAAKKAQEADEQAEAAAEAAIFEAETAAEAEREAEATAADAAEAEVEAEAALWAAEDGNADAGAAVEAEAVAEAAAQGAAAAADKASDAKAKADQAAAAAERAGAVAQAAEAEAAEKEETAELMEEAGGRR